MLLTVLIVGDELSAAGAESLKAAIAVGFKEREAWTGKHEIRTVILGEDATDEASGEVPGIGALLVRSGEMARCKGKYVWILPTLAGPAPTTEGMGAVLDLLSINADAVVLDHWPGSARKNAELCNSAIEALPIPRLFEEFRYILPRTAWEACYAKDALFLSALVYLSFLESKGGHAVYGRVFMDFSLMSSRAGHALVSLCGDHFSGRRPGQREALLLPQALDYRTSRSGPHPRFSPREREVFWHALSAACDFIESYANSLFQDSYVGLNKEEAFSRVTRLLAQLQDLAARKRGERELIASLANLSFFLSSWRKLASRAIRSENLASPEATKSPFDGIWWLGAELKSEFNTMGKQRLLALLSEVPRRHSGAVRVERSGASPDETPSHDEKVTSPATESKETTA